MVVVVVMVVVVSLSVCLGFDSLRTIAVILVGLSVVVILSFVLVLFVICSILVSWLCVLWSVFWVL